MREVKEKSPLKECAAETLKSTPQAAFRCGTDASFQQLRQELRDAAQDGQPEDRYESGKITDTADHTVQEARHLAEKAVHKLPKTKSKSEARTKSVPQHERPQHQQPKKQVEAVKTDARQPKERNNCNLTQLSATKSTLAEQRSLGQSPASTELSAPATTPTTPPAAPSSGLCSKR